MAPPKRNLNSLRSGKRITRHMFVLGELGPRHQTVRQHLITLRRKLMTLCRQTYGSVDCDMESAISLIVRHELVALLAVKGIREGTGDAVQLARTSAQASQERDRMLHKLGLSRQRGREGIDWDLAIQDESTSAWDRLDDLTAEEEAARLAAGDQDGADQDVDLDPTDPPGEAVGDQDPDPREATAGAVGDQDPDPREASAAAVADQDVDLDQDVDQESAEALTPPPGQQSRRGGCAEARAPSSFRFQNSDSADQGSLP